MLFPPDATPFEHLSITVTETELRTWGDVVPSDCFEAEIKLGHTDTAAITWHCRCGKNILALAAKALHNLAAAPKQADHFQVLLRNGETYD